MEALPDEISLYILKFLSAQEWCIAMLLNKHFYRIASNNSLWTRFLFVIKASEPPSPRVCHSAVVYKQCMYIFGGHDPEPGSNYISDVKNELYEFNLETRLWRHIEGINFPLRTEHASILYNGKMYVFGGYSGLGEYRNDVVVCHLERGFEWEVIVSKGDAPQPRSAHSACIYKGKVYIFGGWDGRYSNNHFYQFNIEKCTWKKVRLSLHNSGNIPEPRRSHGCVQAGTSMYIFGGFDGGKNVPPLLHRFDFKKKKWTVEKAQGSPPCGRSRSRMILYHNTIAVFGGWDRINHFQKWHEYNLETKTWTMEELEFPGKGIGQHSSVIYNNCVYVYGGYNEAQKSSSSSLWGYFLGNLGKKA